VSLHYIVMMDTNPMHILYFREGGFLGAGMAENGLFSRIELV
jgi:hypothetical protein